MTTLRYTDEADCRNSSAISELYYDEGTKTAFVAFPSGDFWAYEIEPEVWKDWRGANSLGHFYTWTIKGHNKGRYLGPFVDFEKADAVTAPAITYIFTGTRTQSVSDSVEVNDGADSLDRALAAFRAKYPDTQITGITTAPRD